MDDDFKRLTKDETLYHWVDGPFNVLASCAHEPMVSVQMYFSCIHEVTDIYGPDCDNGYRYTASIGSHRPDVMRDFATALNTAADKLEAWQALDASLETGGDV